MSHDLDFTTGRAAMAYVGTPPWHGLGCALEPGQPIDVWLDAAGLDWQLERLPVQYLAQGRFRTMPGRYVLARGDTLDALSVVAEGYRIVQPREVVLFYKKLVDECGYVLETAGALDHGRKVWALARTGRTARISGVEGDEIAAYVLLATSCDKSLATTAAFTSIRVVCQNTLNFAMHDVGQHHRRHVKVPHTRRFVPKDLYDQLGLLDPAWERFLAWTKAAAQRRLDAQQARQYFGRVLERSTVKAKPLQDGEEREVPARAECACQTLMGLYGQAPGQNLPTAKDTLWGAVNAVTYYVDHVRGGGGAKQLDSAWFGSGYGLKQAAWEEAQQLLGAEA